jgi:hypothetical protein
MIEVVGAQAWIDAVEKHTWENIRAQEEYEKEKEMAAVLSLARAGADPNRRDENGGAFYTLVPIRPRRRGERRSLRTFPGVSLRPHLAFNPRPRPLSTPTDAFQLHPNFALYGTTRRHPGGSGGEAFARGSRRGVRFRRERRRRS